MKNLSLFLLDYADIIYEKPFNESCKTKIEKTRYRAAPVTQVTGLESLADRIWSRKILFFHKIVNGL